jgi:hypothetical protein
MVLCVYLGDDGFPYNVGISSANETPGGFVAAASGAQLNYPRGWKPRHVLGKTVTGGHHKLEVYSVATAIFVSGTTFTITYILGGASTFSVQGRIGELRAIKA